MFVKNYGICLAYPPTVDLRAEGLGRHLAMFLKGAEGLTDVRFTIVCPSWTRETLEDLFESEQVPQEIFKILSPEGKPYALNLFDAIRKYRTRPSRQRWGSRIAKLTLKMGELTWKRLTARSVAVHNAGTLVIFLAEALFLLLILAPLLILTIPVALLIAFGRLRIFRHQWQVVLAKISAVLAAPHREKWVLGLFDEMQKHEMSRMQSRIASLTDVRAWYCPTAFWPGFHDNKVPLLMCVPDVVLSDFPVGFSAVGGDRFLAVFESIGCSIAAGEHFVTYSESVKWNTLVDRYSVPAANVTVINHAPNALNRHIEVSGFPDVAATSRCYCQTLLRGAFQRSTNQSYTATFQNGDVKFLFYASQFRPNKNVLTLLRAYEHLLRKRYLGHKLLLTGHPADMPQIGQFVVDHRLENDVIFLHGLNISELAACYKLADLAVNPSLSEGGCPFTFTEALSVDTPVVMARIPVTEEVLIDPELRSASLFDPYRWRDMADRIEWALSNREELLAIQRNAYADLTKRNWTDVVKEHVDALEKIVAVTSRQGTAPVA